MEKEVSIDSKDYCDNKQCPLHTECEIETYRTSITYLKIEITDSNISLSIPIPCLLCSHAKKLDFGNIMRKAVTTAMLQGKTPIIGG